MPQDFTAAGRHQRPLTIALILTGGFLIAEVGGGLMTDSSRRNASVRQHHA